MSDQLKLFFNQTISLCYLYSHGQFPKDAKNALDKWAKETNESLCAKEVIEKLSLGLEKLRKDCPSLGNVIQSELDAVVILQTSTLGSADKSKNIQPSNHQVRMSRKLISRAIHASRSLLGSLQEVLKESVPSWIIGLLKVAEEITEIYGPKN